MSVSVNVNVNLNGVRPKIESIAKNDKLGTFMASTFARYMDEFVPFQSGALATTLSLEPFKVTYLQPYASKMYEGSNFKFNREKHLLATSHWDKAMISAKKNEISSEISDFIKTM